MNQLAKIFDGKRVPSTFDTQEIIAREYTKAYIWNSLAQVIDEYKKYDVVGNPCLNRHMRCVIFTHHAVAIFFDDSVKLPLPGPGFADYRKPTRVRYYDHKTKTDGCLLYETSLGLAEIMVQHQQGEFQSLKEIIVSKC